MELTAVELERLSEVIARRSGLVFSEARWPFLRRRARAVMAREGFTSGSCWTTELDRAAGRGASLYAELEAALHVHETSFFRYPGHHEALRDVVLPAVVAERSRRRAEAGAAASARPGERLRIWSVGCSTGEEPYSLAMTVRESLPPDVPVEILAVDVSHDALRAAALGQYRAAEVAAVPPGLLARYFRNGGEAWTVDAGLRDIVRFVHYDVRHGLYAGKFDVIVCCNVLLYFTAAVKRDVLTRLAGSLRPGGYLFLGHADGATPPAAHFDVRRSPHGFIYRRRATATTRVELGE
ncbi:MAG: CheR family methyltransferase [Candidatus Rokuibacteriota bacterium]